MNGKDIEQLLESSWRRKLTPDEILRLEAWVRERPDRQAELTLDASLGRALRDLPDVPVSSNFTHRVLQAVEKEAAQTEGLAAVWRWAGAAAFRRWVPRVAVAGVVCLGILATWHHRAAEERAQMAASLQNVASLATMPVSDEPTDVEMWRDFEIIRRLGSPTADDELIAAFEQK